MDQQLDPCGAQCSNGAAIQSKNSTCDRRWTGLIYPRHGCFLCDRTARGASARNIRTVQRFHGALRAAVGNLVWPTGNSKHSTSRPTPLISRSRTTTSISPPALVFYGGRPGDLPCPGSPAVVPTFSVRGTLLLPAILDLGVGPNLHHACSMVLDDPDEAQVIRTITARIEMWPLR